MKRKTLIAFWVLVIIFFTGVAANEVWLKKFAPTVSSLLSVKCKLTVMGLKFSMPEKVGILLPLLVWSVALLLLIMPWKHLRRESIRKAAKYWLLLLAGLAVVPLCVVLGSFIYKMFGDLPKWVTALVEDFVGIGGNFYIGDHAIPDEDTPITANFASILGLALGVWVWYRLGFKGLLQKLDEFTATLVPSQPRSRDLAEVK